MNITDKAYKIATGNHLTESFTYDEFQEIDTWDYVTESFENWDMSDLDEHIASIASNIISEFRNEP